MRVIKAVDLFCGCGGTSAGLYEAGDELGLTVDLLAINHWTVAVKTHSYNHSLATHLCENLDNVNPRKVVPGRHLNIMIASPECTHHSKAKSGKPRDEQSRASAWHICRWGEALRIDDIVVENVPEFVDWRPLRKDGHPENRYSKGYTFRGWLNALASLGYRVEWRILNAADYGDATNRNRFILRARRGRRRITWPDATHATSPSPDQRPHRTARDIIDWSVESQSIFGRKKPLCDNTMRRIAAGMRKFCGTNIEPFIVAYHGGPDSDRRTHSVNAPLPTQDCSNRFALCEPRPFLVNLKGKSNASSIDWPMPTQTTRQHLYLCQPFLTKYYKSGISKSVDLPLDTITTKPRFGLVEPVAGKTGIDIYYRMLEPHELSAAHSLENYTFFGNKADVVKQIGNSVPKQLARAICREVLAA